MLLGCDIGTAATKAVLIKDDKLLHKVKVATNANPDDSLQRVHAAFASEAGISATVIEQTAITGWGQQKVSAQHINANHMNCLAKAAVWSEPSARSALCLGAQQGIALSIGKEARLLDYRVSDKCANGAGKFLDVISEALGCTVEETAAIAELSTNDLSMSSQCAVFAESEVVSLVNAGEPVPDIMEAIFRSLIKNVATLCKRVRVKGPLVLGGGLMNNHRLVAILNDSIKTETAVFAQDPDYMAAVGAALLAKRGN